MQPMQPAPFLAPVPAALSLPRSVFVRAADGVRLRVVHYPPPAGGAGWLLMLPGRSEWAEKYLTPAADFATAGYGLLMPDWRGQALSDRLHPDPRLGHVGRFADYRLDLAATLAVAEAWGLGPPAGLVAHSMGGTIALAALADGLAVPAAVFSAPMWGLAPATYLRPALRLARDIVRRAGRGEPPPDVAAATYIAEAPFEGNVLTADPDLYAAVQAMARAHPGLALGNPTLRWLLEALREMRRLASAPLPAVPALAAVGSQETLVAPGAIRDRIARWPSARLMVIEGARHEPMIEVAAVRRAFVAASVALIAGAGRRAA
jgi:lysophospholipase